MHTYHHSSIHLSRTGQFDSFELRIFNFLLLLRISIKLCDKLFESAISIIDHFSVSHDYPTSIYIESVRNWGIVVFRWQIFDKNFTKLSVYAFTPIVTHLWLNFIDYRNTLSLWRRDGVWRVLMVYYRKIYIPLICVIFIW